MIQLKNYINDEFLEPIQNEWLDNYNPSNGSVSVSYTHLTLPTNREV